MKKALENILYINTIGSLKYSEFSQDNTDRMVSLDSCRFLAGLLEKKSLIMKKNGISIVD